MLFSGAAGGDLRRLLENIMIAATIAATASNAAVIAVQRNQERADVERATAAAVGALGGPAFTGLLDEGRRLSAREAADYPAAGS